MQQGQQFVALKNPLALINLHVRIERAVCALIKIQRRRRQRHGGF
jgi:hypothetical protein